MDANWIEWNGGKRPVHANKRVDVKLRDGRILTRVASLPQCMWGHQRGDADIVAYRLHQK